MILPNLNALNFLMIKRLIRANLCFRGKNANQKDSEINLELHNLDPETSSGGRSQDLGYENLNALNA
ncbi:hypothetical protein QFZ20_001989 [Flavobacterium sp. W4I14]|nr:hypothetical protein [Flavobacterium sp. W4I14]